MKTRITFSTWVVIFLTALSMPVWAQFSGSGSGISTDPYIITSGDELTQVRNYLNKPTVCFKLLNDVDLIQWIAENNPTQGWLPIGNFSTNAFCGNFNGNNCKIIGLKISRPTTDYVGLFGYLNSGANIHDLTLNQCDVSGQNNVGVLAGYAKDETKFNNIIIQGNLTGVNYAGILIGYASGIKLIGRSEIKNITIQGNVTANNYVGILAGYIDLSYSESKLVSHDYSFSMSFDNVELHGDLVGGLNVGGFTGGINCNVYSAVTSDSATISLSNINMEGTVSGQGNTGGLVGEASTISSGIIRAYCHINGSKLFFKGLVKGQENTGGLFGQIYNKNNNYINGLVNIKIENSGFVGNVSGLNYVGGINGSLVNSANNYATEISNCFASGNISGLAGCGGILGFTPPFILGGVVGNIFITNCHSHCNVTGTTSVGGISGYVNSPYIVNNYSTGNVRGTSNVGGIIGEANCSVNHTTTVHSNVSINNVISGGSSVGRITGLVNVSETLTSAQSNYGWTLTKVIVNNINTSVDDSYQHGISYGLSQFKRKATYQGISWDFTTNNFWGIVENQSYPYFTWQTPPAVITTSPIKAGNTSISGTSVPNAIINVTVGGKQYTTTASSLNWNVVVDPMLGGDSITVIAMQDNLGWSYPVRGIAEFEGSGTLADPFKIYTARDLKAIESNMMANYKLMNDIDLTSWIQSNASATGWSSIGSKETSLMGSLNGDNKKITGFWQSSSQTSCGLVASVSTDGALRNLTIQTATGKKTSGLDYTAMVTGYNYGTIESCNASGIVQGYNVGSIAGYNAGTIKKCVASGLITSIVSSGKAGGIAGDNTGLISECDYTGDITCNVGSGYLGGISGSSTNSVANCYYSGTLSSSIATAHVGGIVGLNSGLISTSYSLGTINASGATAYAGGIAGDNNSTTSEINNSESGMNINSTGASTVCGGVVGITKGKVINCYASGAISSGYRGSGVVGYMEGTGAKVLGCVGLNTNISGKNSVCRVLGGIMNSATEPSSTDNYGCKDMLITINGVVQPIPPENYMQGIAKDRVDLKKQSFYEGISWDFVSTWYINEGIDYPYLRFLLKPVNGVILNKSSITLNVGANETLIATITPTTATYQNVTWTSSDLTVATVDAIGKVTAISIGSATIIITTTDQNKTAQCLVTVVQPVTGVTLNKSTTTLLVGANETLTLTLAPTNATNKTVTWTSSDATIATVDATGKVSAVSIGSVTITVTTTDQSKTAQCVVSVVILPVTAGTISGTTTVCQGQNSVTYSLPTIANTTSYIWTLPSGATGTSLTNSISVNYGAAAVSGNITVKGHNASGDGAISILAITVNPLPVSAGTITENSSAYKGTSETYTISAITGATSYIWTLSAGITGTSTTNSITVTFGSTTSSGNIKVKGHNSCGDGLERSLALTINDVSAGVITGTSSVCKGTTQIYTVQTIAGATSYIWTLPTGVTGSSSTNSISVIFGTNAVSGNIKVKGHNSGGDGAESTFALTVNDVPSSSGSITGNISVCKSALETYSVSAISGATSYVWTLPTGATGISTTNSISVNYSSIAVSGNITVNGHNACGDGITSTLAIIVNPLPENAGTITGSVTICQGQNSVSYTLPAIANATSYVWTLPTGAIGTSTTNSISVNYDATAVSGNITVKGQNDCGDGVASTLAIIVNPLPGKTGPVTGPSYACQGNIVFYSVPAISNATSYIWTLPTGAIGTSTTNSISVIYGSSVVLDNIIVKGHNDCGDGVASILAIRVNPLPGNAGTITGTAAVCQGQNSVSYTLPAIANATSYVWTLPIGATGTSTTNSISVNYDAAAVSGNITVKGHNACGDGVASALAITVNPLPENAGTITGSAAICQGQNSVSYTLPAIANATSYLWSLPAGAIGTSTTNSISVNYDAAAVSGNITVKGQNDCGDGIASALAIIVNPLPGKEPITGPSYVCQGNIEFYSVSEIANASSYIWTLPKGAIGTSTTNSISVNYSEMAVSGNISVRGHNDCGDGIDSTLAIIVNPLPENAGTITGSATICQGQNSVSYILPAIANATSYIWSLPAGAIGTSITNSITVNYDAAAVSGDIIVKGHNDCGDGVASTLLITVNPLPQQPDITQIGDVLHSTSLVGNQWYNNNGLITSATNQEYTPNTTGDYYVVVSNIGCNSQPSNSFHFIQTGIYPILLAKTIKVYPNPTTNELTIEIEGNTNNTEFDILSTIGQVIFTGIMGEKTVVKTSSYVPGVYLVRLKSGDTFEFKKVLKK